MTRRAWAVVVLVGIAGCRSSDKHAASDPPAVPAMSAGEVKRGQDACKAYLEKVCACAERGVTALAEPCSLAKAYPEAMQVGLDVAATPDSTRRDVLQAQDSVRKIVKACIEETAKLPALGCS